MKPAPHKPPENTPKNTRVANDFRKKPRHSPPFQVTGRKGVPPPS